MIKGYKLVNETTETEGLIMNQIHIEINLASDTGHTFYEDIKDKFTPEALKLMALYADKNDVLDEIGCTLDSFASVGSVVPYYETHKKIYSSLLQNQRTEIREWAQRQINACNYYIQHAQINEEEKL